MRTLHGVFILALVDTAGLSDQSIKWVLGVTSCHHGLPRLWCNRAPTDCQSGWLVPGEAIETAVYPPYQGIREAGPGKLALLYRHPQVVLNEHAFEATRSFVTLGMLVFAHHGNMLFP